MSIVLIRWLYKKYHPVAKALINSKCDIVFFPSQDAWCFQIPIKSVGVILDLMHRYEPSFPEVSSFGRKVLREMKFNNMCRYCYAIIVESEYGKKQAIDSYCISDNKVYVLPLLPPKYILIADKKDEIDISKKYKLPSKYLFYPAQFWYHKNHSNLILAISSLKIELPDLKLVLVGSKKNAYKDVLKLIKKHNLCNDILILNYVPDNDIIQLYKNARALIMPTFFGPSNIPPLESFHLDCPVATSNIYGIPEQVGEAAILFNPKSIDEIANTIRKLWTDDELCKDLVSKGIKKDAQWNQTHFNDRFSSIMNQLL